MFVVTFRKARKQVQGLMVLISPLRPLGSELGTQVLRLSAEIFANRSICSLPFVEMPF